MLALLGLTFYIFNKKNAILELKNITALIFLCNLFSRYFQKRVLSHFSFRGTLGIAAFRNACHNL